MESKDPASLDTSGEAICALEWIALAMDAAWRVAEREDSARFRLDYSQLYTEKLSGL